MKKLIFSLLLFVPIFVFATSTIVDQSYRSIAEIQEEGFDKELNRYHQCYGVQFSFEHSTESRRRECKAHILHKLKIALADPGTYFDTQLQFQCRSNSDGHTRWWDWRSQPVLRLKPNREYEVLEQAIKLHLQKTNNITSWLKAKKACDFYLKCRDAINLQNFSFSQVKSCFFDLDNESKGLIRRELLAMIFGTKTDGILMADFLQN